jgi:drug/metabolite transporter (DMT)-like permease
MKVWKNPGVMAALGAALLFGASTPFAKLLLGSSTPWMAAGLLYLGSGVGLAIYRWGARLPRVHLNRSGMGWLAGAILAGGVIAPVLLLFGLSRMPASGASLLLNAEGVLTALLAWIVFRENVDRRVALGMALIVAGAVVLSWPSQANFGDALLSLSVLGACLGWAIDNNLTRKVALTDATFVAMAKGLVAGGVNIALAWASGAAFPRVAVVLGAGIVGFLGYGVSLTLFVIALRHLGTARTGAYFSTAPFTGALLAIPLLSESLSVQTIAAAILMGFGVYLHLTEHHYHAHMHQPMEHEHKHLHDEHHAHGHEQASEGPHSHAHRHEVLIHSHPHYPDAHHEHEH